MHAFPALLLALLLVLPAFSQAPPAPDVAGRIRQVETHLSPALRIEGQPAVTFNLTDRMRHYKVPAVSIAVVNNGRIEWARAYGHPGRDSLRKADTLTLFQAASISKPVAALAALHLVEKDKLDLDADVNKYLKTWKVKDSRFTADKPVTLRGLLTHSAGLTVHGFRGYARGEAVPTLRQVLDGSKPANSAAVVADTTPGSRWRYSGGGYVLMQQLVEDVTGTDFERTMQRLVLGPAGMKHSTYAQPLTPSLQARASIGHASDGRPVPGDWHTYPERAAAGLWTTPSDLARYILAVQQSRQGQSNRILSREMTDRMLTKGIGGWGLGPRLGGEKEELLFSHGGSNEGYRCEMHGFVTGGRGVVVMTNSDNGGDLIAEIIRSVSHAYGWEAFKPVAKKRARLTAEELKAFAGTYVEREQGLRIQVTPGDNALMVKQLWNGRERTLFAEAGLHFYTNDEGAPVVFDAAANGTITGMLVPGPLKFTREP
ncbi:MAG: Beta-lactamase class C-like and penicillin binding proteins (PBPs) superfamily [uncultured Cytophagales bacterium]|uniref:Beta-lactamase class C-like and penicillin binding proteins (PBPs) superfamily n=1 Tax=uncultured Cytophagales bacterium TaxID=158755 RepID=A0A6J4KDQ0_9SPHI|nr:MAG: Beta-lactamase class C-like and penicillin binding proteins (PBPs) superfamily [uncultured Cytophagales bacterium]